jgi:hypothetical protein
VVHARLALRRGDSVHISVDQITLSGEALGSPLSPGSYVTITFAYMSKTGAEPVGKTSPPEFLSKDTASEMGLASVLAALQQSGGSLALVRTSGQLATVTVFLPSADVIGP